MRFEMRVDNFEEARTANRQVRERILTKIGMYGQGQSKLNCPVDKGDLRSSIQYKVNDIKSVAIGTNKEYGKFVHEGTKKMAGRPFIKNAITQNIRQIRNIAESELRRGFN